MKKTCIHTLLLVLLLLGMPLILAGQRVPGASLLRSPLFREKLILTTDRTLYAAGDRILFRVFNASDPLLKENQWSMVLYLELINDRQVAVSRGKFLFGARGTTGQMTIPDTVTTGSYYLRTYTRWMRNFSANAFATLPLGVVNPRQMGSAGSMLIASDSVPSGTPPDGANVPPDWGRTEAGIWCEPERSLYRKRDRMAVRVRAEEGIESIGGFAVSVVKKDFTDPVLLGYSALGRATIGAEGTEPHPPETRGISLSGKIVRREDRTPVPFARMHVTLLGDTPDYVALVADQQGEILFCVPPRPGVSNALIAFDPEKGASLEFVMDEAFSTEYPVTPVLPGYSLQHRADAVRELLMLSQLREAFDLRYQGGEAPDDSLSRTFFYGAPEYSYLTADYVALPNLQEFFFELVPQVSVQRYRGQYTLSVMDDAGYFLEYTPLILLDHVVMQDMEALLSIDPALLKTIDVVNSVYIRGNNIYGGIISMISKEGNLAGAGLPEGATMIDLQTFDRGQGSWPQAIALPSRKERLPDLRTTLYWEPAKELTAGGEAVLEFRASDIPGTYVITVTGVTPDGKVIRSACECKVE